MSSCIMAMSIRYHHNDVIMSPIAFQITSLTIVYSTVYSGTDERKHQSFASLAFVRGIHHCEFPTQRASNAENVFIWWRHHDGDSFTAFQVWPFSTISFMLHAVSSTFDPFFHLHFFSCNTMPFGTTSQIRDRPILHRWHFEGRFLKEKCILTWILLTLLLGQIQFSVQI